MSNFDVPSRGLSGFERRVLDLILEGDSPEAGILQNQATVAEVSQRSEPGGSGAWLWLDIPDDVPRLSPPISIQVSNLQGMVGGEDGELVATFNLHIRAGALAALEIIAPAKPWPQQPTLRSWYYLSKGRRGLVLPAAP